MTEELQLERMVHGGVVLAHAADGRVALVRGGIPGERVRAQLAVVKGVLRGEVVEVIEPSPERVPAPAHPGLDYGHIAYARQLELKAEVVADALRRTVGSDVEVPPVRPSPRLWRYRATVQPALTRSGLGYRRPGSHDVVVLDEDPTALEAVAKGWRSVLRRSVELAGVHEVVLRGNEEGDVLAALISSVPERSLIEVAHTLVADGITGVSYAAYDPRGRFRSGSGRLAGARGIRQRYGDFDLSVNATSFAQPNPLAAAELYAALAGSVPGGAHALELFAGGGAIAFHLARRYASVTALELDRSAIARGKADAERLGIDNVRFVRADLRSAPSTLDADLVVVDPPRAGLSAELRGLLADSRASELVYVSCDVATWARDVADLESRGWRLRRFEPFDLYPHTHHIEVLASFGRE